MYKRISWAYLAVLVCVLSIYILPSYYFEIKGIPLDSLVAGAFLLYSVIIGFKKSTKVTAFELIYLFLVLVCCIYQTSISPLILLAPFVAIKWLDRWTLEEIKRILLTSKLMYAALFFTIFYSILYGVVDGRFLHTGVGEVNSSGLAVLLLGLIFYKRSKILGYIVLIFGCLSLSRNYYLAIVIIVFINWILRINNFKNIVKLKIFNFMNIIIISSIVLYILGIICQEMYRNGLILYEITLDGRLFNFFDISNYLRFTVNIFLIHIFCENPLFWIVGCRVEDFVQLCAQYAIRNNQYYKGNNPHNFFFSYIKLYGIVGIMDIILVEKLINRIVNNKNFGVYLALMVYAIFLGIAFNNIWVLWSASILYLYAE